MLQEEQYASRNFCHANGREIDAKALMTGLPSKNTLRWLQNPGCKLVQLLLGSKDLCLKELLFPESKPNLGARPTPSISAILFRLSGFT